MGAILENESYHLFSIFDKFRRNTMTANFVLGQWDSWRVKFNEIFYLSDRKKEKLVH